MTNQSFTPSIISKFGFFLYLTVLSMLCFIATDMYLPAFKSIESSFDASTSEVAMSLTIFLAGLAMGQLLYGALVEKWGKRNSLLFGLGVFVAATALIAVSESIMVMNIGRFFQAIGVCSASVIWQALVIEKYDADESQKVLSNIMPLVALSPAVAPLIGAFFLSSWGWQSIFICLAILGAVLVLLTQVFVKADNPSKACKLNITANSTEEAKSMSFRQMLSNPFYVGNVMIFAACSGAFFSYLTLWPAVMDKFGYDATAIGLSFIPQTIMFILGGYGGKLLINRFGSAKALRIQLGLFFASALLISVMTLAVKMTSIYPLLIVFAFLAAANGAIYPIVVNNALQTFKNDAAKAAGLQNFIQISIAFGASSIVAAFASAGEQAIGFGILVSAVMVFCALYASGFKSWSALRQSFVMPDPASVALRKFKD
ncbi:purine nucleoside transporter PunC [Shewanella aestuarii]|uniref:Bcr/CflA family efflux transporter n=1 Tax=Shewanella aestuarii TaxID=1028752 RepID=A0A6G9QJE1_9GAMM|nr:purine nucleoside transporter PunC [Shewanella aestuarii]QIR14684.1 Bcr/CflA family multidrug efflux MFS transporter [Shewanella aestuarii]